MTANISDRGRARRRKGHDWEREVADIFRRAGFMGARRGLSQARGGGKEEADVVGVPGWHIECKCGSTVSLAQAMRQSLDDAGEGEHVLVVARRTGYVPLAVMVHAGAVALGLTDYAMQNTDFFPWCQFRAHKGRIALQHPFTFGRSFYVCELDLALIGIVAGAARLSAT